MYQTSENVKFGDRSMTETRYTITARREEREISAVVLLNHPTRHV